MVKIASTAPGRIVTKEHLKAMGLVAAPEPEHTAATFTARTAPTRTARKVWPDYARTLAGAPPSRDESGPDRSMADFTWCMTAIDWGWSIEETARKAPRRQREGPPARCAKRRRLPAHYGAERCHRG